MGETLIALTALLLIPIAMLALSQIARGASGSGLSSGLDLLVVIATADFAFVTAPGLLSSRLLGGWSSAFVGFFILHAIFTVLLFVALLRVDGRVGEYNMRHYFEKRNRRVPSPLSGAGFPLGGIILSYAVSGIMLSLIFVPFVFPL